MGFECADVADAVARKGPLIDPQHSQRVVAAARGWAGLDRGAAIQRTMGQRGAVVTVRHGQQRIDIGEIGESMPVTVKPGTSPIKS